MSEFFPLVPPCVFLRKFSRHCRRLREPTQKGIGGVAPRRPSMHRGEMGLGAERPLITVAGGPVGSERLSTCTRGEPMNLPLPLPEKTFLYLWTLFSPPRAA